MSNQPESPRPEPQPPAGEQPQAFRNESQPPNESGDIDAVINEAFAEADATGGELPERGALAIARALADHTLAPTPALDTFAATGEADLDAISAEVMRLYNAPGCSEAQKRHIDYLMTFLLDRRRSPDASEPPVDAKEQDLPAAVRDSIAFYGDAFRAFLELPDARVDGPGLLDMFHECYVGRFFSMDEIVRSLTEIDLWETEAEALSDRLGIPVSLDYQFIAAHLRDTWDIIRFGDAFYVFDK